MREISLLGKICSLCLLLLSGINHAVMGAEWQWSVPVAPLASRAAETPRAFLWVPDNCRQIKGVVFAQHNMEEESVLEHPVFRKALADIGFAEVWVVPNFDAYFRFDQNAGTRFETMMKDLGEESGYGELTTVPLVPIGHSAAASLPWYMAAWEPERILACISLSGQWPYVEDLKNAPHVAGRNIDSVPGLVTIGEYEWAGDRMPQEGSKTRATHPLMPLSALACPADGHFEATDEKIDFISLYLRKAVQYRLPKQMQSGGPVSLSEINTTNSGWLSEAYREGKDPTFPAAPVSEYKGDPAKAFWYFDGELAKAAETFQKQHRGKATLLGYIQEEGPRKGLVIPQNKSAHTQVRMTMHPEQDGLTFKLTGTFLDTVPDGRPVRWSGLSAGSPVDQPQYVTAPITIQKITGPAKKISDETWELCFNRTSFLHDIRPNEVYFAAFWPGDATFKRAIQQASMAIPKNAEGKQQTITFNLPKTLPASTRALKLTATSDSGLPVRYYIREGAAEIEVEKHAQTLKFHPLPPRAKYPASVTVVAWQWGTALEPKVQSAEPVTRTVELVK